MKTTAAVIDRLDAWANPIVVKELRQAVQGRFVAGVLLLFLVVQLCVMGGFLLTSNTIDADFSAGRDVFLVLLSILFFTCMFFLPIYAGVRLSAERSDVNVDLLFATTLKPHAIIAGKFVATMILTILIYSACAPFMTFTYLLRGIDLPSIFVILAFHLLIIAATVQFALFVASIPSSRNAKILYGLLALGAIISGFQAAMMAGWAFTEWGIGTSLGSWQFWAAALTVVILSAVGIGLMFVLSVAMISPPSANRILPIRMYLLAGWLIALLVTVYWVYESGDSEILTAWLIPMAGVFSFALLGAISEREHWGPRVAKTIPKRRSLRPFAFLLYSGAAGGVVFSSLMLAATLLAPRVIVEIGSMRWDHDLKELMEIVTPMVIYAFCYAGTAMLIKRTLFPHRQSAAFPTVIALLLLLLLSVGPVLAAFFFMKADWDMVDMNSSKWLFMGNPFAVPMGNDVYRSAAMTASSIWAIIVAVLNAPWLVRQFLKFRPSEPVTIPDTERMKDE